MGKESTIEGASVTLDMWPDDKAAAELKMHREEAPAVPEQSNNNHMESVDGGEKSSAQAEGAAEEEVDIEQKLFDVFTKATVEKPKFIASNVFEGRRPGYVFTTRNGETGYYIDNAPGVQADQDDDEESCPQIGDIEEGKEEPRG